MITESFKRMLLSNLHGQYTSGEDFKLEVIGNTSGNITISYKYKPVFSFIIYLNSKGATRIKFSPGNMMKVDEYQSTTNPEESFRLPIQKNEPSEKIDLNTYFITSKISDWISNIENELETMPEIRKIKEHDEKIRSIEDEINELFTDHEDSIFSVDEITQLKERLNKLEGELETKIKENKDKHEEQDKLINDLRKEINTLKVQSNLLTKQNWFKSFYTRMYTLMKRHPKLTAMIGVSAYSILPEEIKGILPEGYEKILLPELAKVESEEVQEVTEEQE